MVGVKPLKSSNIFIGNILDDSSVSAGSNVYRDLQYKKQLPSAPPFSFAVL